MVAANSFGARTGTAYPGRMGIVGGGWRKQYRRGRWPCRGDGGAFAPDLGRPRVTSASRLSSRPTRTQRRRWDPGPRRTPRRPTSGSSAGRALGGRGRPAAGRGRRTDGVDPSDPRWCDGLVCVGAPVPSDLPVRGRGRTKRRRRPADDPRAAGRERSGQGEARTRAVGDRKRRNRTGNGRASTQQAGGTLPASGPEVATVPGTGWWGTPRRIGPAR